MLGKSFVFSSKKRLITVESMCDEYLSHLAKPAQSRRFAINELFNKRSIYYTPDQITQALALLEARGFLDKTPNSFGAIDTKFDPSFKMFETATEYGQIKVVSVFELSHAGRRFVNANHVIDATAYLAGDEKAYTVLKILAGFILGVASAIVVWQLKGS